MKMVIFIAFTVKPLIGAERGVFRRVSGALFSGAIRVGSHHVARWTIIAEVGDAVE